MTRLFLLVALAATCVQSASAQRVQGTVTSGRESVPFATVRLLGTTRGAVADSAGRYGFAIPGAGTYRIAVTSIGYEAANRDLTVAAGETARLDVALESSASGQGALVVTGTMQQVGVRDSPVKVEVIPARFLETSPTASVADAVDRVNGLTRQVDCGVCYTSSIRINGVEGPNTAFLIDGMPVMSSLAAVYGFDSISPVLVRQIEVVKGPMSTLYGSEALGGVVNIITKDPATAPGLSANGFRTSDGETVAEFAAVPLRGRVSALLSGTGFYFRGFDDRNSDGFSDHVNAARLSLFGKLTATDRRGFERASLIARTYAENRFNGVEAFVSDPGRFRGSSEIYGESIRTRRSELIGRWRPRPEVEVQSAVSLHDQDSFYGDAAYDAVQNTAFVQTLVTPNLDATAFRRHGLLVGAALRGQRYDDNSGATGLFSDTGDLAENQPDDRIVPGLFVQDDWELSDYVRLLGGYRADLQPGYGVVQSPRAALKWQPTRASTVRLNTGTGFRLVNLFTEDHQAYAGGRATVILENLEPERSRSLSLSAQQILPGNVTLDLDAFWTRFSNKIEPDYSEAGQILYRNLDGSATTRGLSAQVQGEFGTVSYTVGATLLDVFLDDRGARRDLEYAPDYQATATITYAAPAGLVLDYTVRYTGPVVLPSYDAETRIAYQAATGAVLLDRSPAFGVHNLQVSRTIPVGARNQMQVYAAVENATDFRQPSPLVGYYEGTPGFGATFDTTYAYGPITGRHIGLGARLFLP